MLPTAFASQDIGAVTTPGSATYVDGTYDVTVMDLQMPEMNGLDALIAIRNDFPDAKMIMLTTYKSDTQIVRALKAGAQGYLLKNVIHKELLPITARMGSNLIAHLRSI